jgi:hypothetical protein
MVLFPQVFGPAGLFSSLFLNPQNVLYGLAFLVPLILLYLIKPKPVNVAVPSLMFILKDMGKSNVHRFFRTLFRDILFIIQALAILLLALSLAKPYIDVDQESLVRQSIIIVDVSASTGATDRFDDIQAEAIAALTRENIIIVARANPYTLEENGNPRLPAGKAESMIEDLVPSDMKGDLPTALDLAAQHVAPDSKITIVSDFVLSDLESVELIEARIKVLRSKGALVEIIPIEAKGSNIGIIDATLNSQNATLEIKIQNFNDKPEEIGLKYNGKDVALAQPVLAPDGKPGSLLSVSIPLAHGKSEITLTPKDDFDTDNHYFASIHDRDRVNVLIISNEDLKESRVIPALNAAGDSFTRINVEHAIPPKIPRLEHDIYIIKDANPEFILPGIMRDLRERVEAGAILVVFAQDGLFRMPDAQLMPVFPRDADQLGGRQEIIVNGSLGLLRGLSYIGQVDGGQLMRVQRSEDALVHAYVMTNAGQEPVIAHKRIGKGAVIYYGIKDQKAADIDPQSYAVIWGRIVDYSIPDSRLLNVPTGAIITSVTKNVLGPDGKRQSPTIADQAGIYQAGETAIAANLYALRTSSAAEATGVRYESVIDKGAKISAADVAASANNGETKAPKDLSTIIIIIGMAVILFELLYVKLRGDL